MRRASDRMYRADPQAAALTTVPTEELVGSPFWLFLLWRDLRLGRQTDDVCTGTYVTANALYRALFQMFGLTSMRVFRCHVRTLQRILPRIHPYRRMIQGILHSTTNKQPQHILRTPCLRPRLCPGVRVRVVRRNRSRVRMPLLAHNADLTGIAFDVHGTGIHRTTADCWRHRLSCSFLDRNDNVGGHGGVQSQAELPPLHQCFFHRLLCLQIRIRLRQRLLGIRLYHHEHSLRPQYGVRQNLLFLLLRNHATRQHHDTRKQCQYSYSHMPSSVRAGSRFYFSHCTFYSCTFHPNAHATSKHRLSLPTSTQSTIKWFHRTCEIQSDSFEL